MRRCYEGHLQTKKQRINIKSKPCAVWGLLLRRRRSQQQRRQTQTGLLLLWWRRQRRSLWWRLWPQGETDTDRDAAAAAAAAAAEAAEAQTDAAASADESGFLAALNRSCACVTASAGVSPPPASWALPCPPCTTRAPHSCRTHASRHLHVLTLAWCIVCRTGTRPRCPRSKAR